MSKTPAGQLCFLEELLNSGILCKCPGHSEYETEDTDHGPHEVEVWVIDHTPECEGIKKARELLNGPGTP